MSVCHTLTTIDDELVGDPLDFIVFQSTGFNLKEPRQKFDQLGATVIYSSHAEYGQVRSFPFSSSRQCQSVVVRAPEADHFTVFCKGSPERVVARMSKPETIPDDFEQTLRTFTEKGYRVIAVGKRELEPSVKVTKVHRMERDEAERDLQFLGLVVLENRIKPQTAPVIKTLHDAKLRTVMITGDNTNTAISVANECGMVKPG